MPERLTASENYAALSERVSGLSEDVHNIRNQVAEMANNVAIKLESLAQRFDERNKTQWPTLISAGGFLLAVMVTIGTLAYGPFKTEIERNALEIKELRAQYVSDLQKKIERLERRVP